MWVEKWEGKIQKTFCSQHLSFFSRHAADRHALNVLGQGETTLYPSYCADLVSASPDC